MVNTNSIAFYADVGRRIRRARKAVGLTQQALASLVSLSRTSVTNLEQGRQKLLVHTLVDVALALRVQPADLLPRINSAFNSSFDKLVEERSPIEQAWIRAAVGVLPSGQLDAE